MFEANTRFSLAHKSFSMCGILVCFSFGIFRDSCKIFYQLLFFAIQKHSAMQTSLVNFSKWLPLKNLCLLQQLLLSLELGILLNDKNRIYRIKMWVRKRKNKKTQMVQMYLYYIV